MASTAWNPARTMLILWIPWLKQVWNRSDTCACDYPLRLLLLRHQSKDEYLLGHPNFYAITRYNQSTHYAMAVHELALAIKRGYQRVAVNRSDAG
ncbi:lytic murein transglycosylase [Methylomonas sp. BW4-1]|uniref:lytic murein transglycosylase n=1 Tax=Methylomonas sp. BW4-1 TaxID=3376685 RepID=UPI004041A03A